MIISLFETPEQAAEAGFVYREPNFTGVLLDAIVIVRKGTIGNNATLDLILNDEKGNKYVALVKARELQIVLNII